MAKPHDTQTLLNLLAELYVVADTVFLEPTICDQIMAALDGEPLPCG